MLQDGLLKLQVRQLERLLSIKRVSFRDAHYIIFSDYPTKSFYQHLIRSIELDESLHKQFIKNTK